MIPSGSGQDDPRQTDDQRQKENRAEFAAADKGAGPTRADLGIGAVDRRIQSWRVRTGRRYRPGASSISRSRGATGHIGDIPRNLRRARRNRRAADRRRFSSISGQAGSRWPPAPRNIAHQRPLHRTGESVSRVNLGRQRQAPVLDFPSACAWFSRTMARSGSKFRGQGGPSALGEQLTECSSSFLEPAVVRAISLSGSIPGLGPEPSPSRAASAAGVGGGLDPVERLLPARPGSGRTRADRASRLFRSMCRAAGAAGPAGPRPGPRWRSIRIYGATIRCSA